MSYLEGIIKCCLLLDDRSYDRCLQERAWMYCRYDYCKCTMYFYQYLSLSYITARRDESSRYGLIDLTRLSQGSVDSNSDSNSGHHVCIWDIAMLAGLAPNRKLATPMAPLG